MNLLNQKSLIIYIIVYLFFLPGFVLSQDQIDTTINKIDSRGFKQGEWITKDGRNTKIGSYADDQKHGQWVTFNENDYVSLVENYEHGILDGFVVKMDNRGYVNSSVSWNMGEKDGKELEYTYGGRVIGLKTWKNGQLDGLTTLYYDNGKLQENGYYSQNKRHGLTTWYDYDGNKIAEYMYYQGQLNGDQKTFYPTGELKTKETYIYDIMQGEHVQYHKNGAIWYRGLIINGKKDGVWFEYDESGVQKARLNYKNGLLVK